MKVLVFTPYKGMVGGANRSLLMVLQNLKAVYNCELQVFVPAKGDLSDALDKNDIPWTVAPIHEIGSIPVKKTPKNILRALRMWLLAKSDEKNAKAFAGQLKEKFDLVYVNDNCTYFGAVVAKLLGLPYVWHFRTLSRPESNHLTCVKKAYEKCSRFIVISDAMCQLAKENPDIPDNRVERIHNGIPVDEAEKSTQSRENGFHFIQCGRITPDKGQMDAISAIGLLKEKGITDIYLHIVGAVPAGHEAYMEGLQEKVKELGLEKQVIFEGTRNDLPLFRANLNGELMCSECEPFGRVTLEGMRSGLVVIGSNTGGTPEIITDNETGLLYQQGSFEDLAEKIKSVYENEKYAKSLADKAYEFSRTHFTPEANVAAIYATLEKVWAKEK